MKSVHGIQHIEVSRASIKATRFLGCFAPPTEFFQYSVRSRPTIPSPPDRMTPLPPARILPSLPVKESVLHKLGRGIASNELSHELAHLKHNLVFSSVTSSQDNHNTCKNSGLAVVKHFDPKLPELWERLYDTITKRPKVRLVPKRDEDHYASKMEIFKSMFYLDQIAFVCLASGVRACGATDCLRYRRKMKKVVPVCHSWPGLQDWVLCIISCSLRAMRDMESLLIKVVPGSEDLESIVKQLVMELEDKNQSDNPVNKRRVTLLNNQLQTLLKDKASEAGLHGGYDRSPELFHRCWAHVTACIALTMTTNPVAAHCLGWGSEGSGTREGTGNKSASIDGPRPGQNIYSVEWMSVSSRRCPRGTPEYFFLTCRRTVHQRLGLLFMCKHSILYKWEALQVHQLMLLRFSSSSCGFETLQGTMEK